MNKDSIEAFGSPEFATHFDVSCETMERLELFVSLLTRWNNRHNLVSESSLEDVWRRHVLDSAQLINFIPEHTDRIVDLGSGAGLPGIILAELLRSSSPTIVLYEATTKKCLFLREVLEKLDLQAEVRNQRIEDAPREAFDVVTSRACAPLRKLLNYSFRFQSANTTNLFLKGQNLAVELTEARKSWSMTTEIHPSLSSSSGSILEVRGLGRVHHR